MHSKFFLFIIACGIYCHAAIAAEEPQKHAVFIGIRQHQHAELNKPQFEYPEADARELAEIFHFQARGYKVEAYFPGG